MNPKLHPIFIITLILALVTLACGAGAKATQLPPPPTNTPLPPTPAVTLGDEQRSEEGGFAFQPVPGYTVEASFGMVNMLAPGADPISALRSSWLAGPPPKARQRRRSLTNSSPLS